MSIDQKRGILSLIPKRDKDIRYLKNWRPISLLNTDYKIITKVLALRFEKVLSYIISSDQVGYLKGRFIGQNVRYIIDIMDYLKLNEKSGLIGFLDFEKAFDSLEWSFIFKTLKVLNFGPSIIHWTEVIYKDISVCVTNNGFSSEFFKLHRGIRQGCPLSAYLFILSVEILAQNIKDNKNIKGITIGQHECKIAQMADDTTVFIKDIISLHNLLNVLFIFKQAAGLRLNKGKTEIMWLGIKGHRKKAFDLKWTENNVFALGISFSFDRKEMEMQNLWQKLEKMKSCLKLWQQRDLSLKGKITVVKSFALPLINYVTSPLPVPNTFIKEVESSIFKFIWKNKPDKINRQVMCLPYDKGGLKMPNIEIYIQAQKIMWVKRLLKDGAGGWKNYFQWLLDDYDPCTFFNATLDPSDVPFFPAFYYQLVQSWCYMQWRHKCTIDFAATNIINECLWLNSWVKISNKIIYHEYKKWYNAGIIQVGDIIDSSGNFLSEKEIANKFNLHVNTMKYNSLKDAIPREWRDTLRRSKPLELSHCISDPMVVSLGKITKPAQKMKSKTIYTLLTSFNNVEPKCKNRWENIYVNVSFDWNFCFAKIMLINDTKLQSFQFKIVHRIFACNRYIAKGNINISENCENCNVIDTIEHYFCHCNLVKNFWVQLNEWLKNNLKVVNTLSVIEIIFGSSIDVYNFEVNLMILTAKWFIHQAKLNKNNKNLFLEYLTFLRKYINIHLFICARSETVNNFQRISSLLS